MPVKNAHEIEVKSDRSLDPVQVLEMDNHILLAVKPAGVLAQADRTGNPDMLTLLKAYVKERYQKPGAVYLGLVHRLDRPVGGVMVFARTSKAASRLSAQIRERTVEKIYLAVVEGKPLIDCGRLEDNLVKDWEGGHRLAKDKNRPVGKNRPLEKEDPLQVRGRTGSGTSQYRASGRPAGSGGQVQAKPACLNYRLLAYNAEEDLALLQVELHTGRTHQIRLQLSARNMPVWGDRRYGSRTAKQKQMRAKSDGRQPGRKEAGKLNNLTSEIALWAYAYRFDHPTLKERRTALSPPPDRYPWTCFPASFYHEVLDQSF